MSNSAPLAAQEPSFDETNSLRQFVDESAFVLEQGADEYQRVEAQFRTDLYDEFRQELIQQLTAAEDLAENKYVFYEQVDLLVEDLANFHHASSIAHLEKRGLLTADGAEARGIRQDWLRRYEDIEKSLEARARATLESLPELDTDRVQQKLIDRLAKTIIKVIHIDQTRLVTLLGDLAAQPDTPELSNFSDIRPFLRALGIWENVRTSMRILALRSLAAIRSPIAYYWIARCIGERDENGRESLAALEAARLLTHDNDYLPNRPISGAAAASHLTFEKWTGITAALVGRDREFVHGTKRPSVALVEFKKRYEEAVFRSRKARGLNVRGYELENLRSASGVGDAWARLEAQLQEMKKNLHFEKSLDADALMQFIAQNDGYINLYTDLNFNHGPGRSLMGKVRGYLQISPEVPLRSWMSGTIINACGLSFFKH